MEPITGSSNVTLDPVRNAPATPPHTYLGVAESMIPGVKVLADAPPACAPALALVAAHVLECLLKAYLSRDGSDDGLKTLKENAIRHNLEKLWAMAHSQGLQISEQPPDWVVTLSRLHKNPY
ncbi:hypothetical protein [Pseudomonas boanensis]|uniref:hypothetical protein n=1 Tax=Metapseudomonas boanensis TaxID=2822138 RepID=UPI0035D52011